MILHFECEHHWVEIQYKDGQASLRAQKHISLETEEMTGEIRWFMAPNGENAILEVWVNEWAKDFGKVWAFRSCIDHEEGNPW